MMKRLTLKNLLFALIILFPFAGALAQEKELNPFEGGWELTRLASNGTDRVVVPGVMKFFDHEGKFFNLAIGESGPVITHQGNYVVDDFQTYSEIIKAETAGAHYALAGKTYKLRYKFSEDKKLLTVSGMVEGKNGGESLTFTETWKRAEKKDNPVT